MSKPLYQKAAFSIPAQVSHLFHYNLSGITQKDLEVFLANVSYYRLKGYMYPYRDTSKRFVVQNCWAFIESDYNLDQRLRIFLFDCISRVEIAFRSQLVLQMSLAHDSRWYSDSALFLNKRTFESDYEKLKKNWTRSKSDFVKHYNNNYDLNYNPPAWMIFETTTIGSLSKYYENIRISSQGKINFLAYWKLKRQQSTVLASWIKNIALVRNICAHHDRLFSRSLSTRPMLITNPQVEVWQNAWNIANNDKVYCTICILKMMLSVCAPQFDFLGGLKTVLKPCSARQLSTMGIPRNWEQLPLFR